MFEKEIVSLQRIVKERTIGSSQSIALRNILESNIPLNIKGFIKADIESLLQSERKKETRSSRFDYTQEDVRLLLDQLDMLLIFHFNFSQKEFTGTVNRCVHFLFNYLCRPQWTLEHYLFDESDSLSKEELAAKFRFCTDYKYYWTITEKYLHSKNITSLSKDEAVHLLRKIDGEIIKEHSAVELVKMTEPFFQFVSFIQRNSGNGAATGLPVKSLIYFFSDKHIRSVTEHLTKLQDSGTTDVTYDQLTQILKDSFVKKGFSIEEEVLKIKEEQPAPRHNTIIKFSERDRQQIIKTLFGDEESRLNAVIETIASSNSWDDAALSLDHYFTMNDIDAYSREAIIFTNALQTYFSSKQSKDDSI